MHVPETSVHEYSFFPGWKHEVWRTRQRPIVQPVAISTTMQRSSHLHFRLGVFTANSRHIGATLRSWVGADFRQIKPTIRRVHQSVRNQT